MVLSVDGCWLLVFIGGGSIAGGGWCNAFDNDANDDDDDEDGDDGDGDVMTLSKKW